LRLTVVKIKDLVSVILPHFDQYPLLTQKCADYQLFKAIILIILDKKHEARHRRGVFKNHGG
jgi:hypothetical protein